MSVIKITPDTPENRIAVFSAICGDDDELKKSAPERMKFDYTEETSVPSVIGYLDGKFACVMPFKEFKKNIRSTNPDIKLTY